jgi:DNA-binding MarR family transcriptional regulator
MTVDDQQLKGLAEFRYALRHFGAASERINREGGITQQQYQALLALKVQIEAEPSIRTLAGELLLTHHATVQLVDRLAKAGLIARMPSREDRRVVGLTLTAEGESLLANLAALHLQEVLRQEPLMSRALLRLKKVGQVS